MLLLFLQQMQCPSMDREQVQRSDSALHRNPPGIERLESARQGCVVSEVSIICVTLSHATSRSEQESRSVGNQYVGQRGIAVGFIERFRQRHGKRFPQASGVMNQGQMANLRAA